jgi:ATP adenylyltransferase
MGRDWDLYRNNELLGFVMPFINANIKKAAMLLFLTLPLHAQDCARSDEVVQQNVYEVLYAPWRTNSCPLNPYTKAEWKQRCPFCSQFAENADGQHYIIKRFKYVVVMLNLHPYSPGHMMVIPYEHVATLDGLPRDARQELMEVLSESLVALKEVIRYHGVNVGINIGGKGTGGSIPDHIHVHIVPRWEGDNSFMASIAQTRVMNCEVQDLYTRIAEHFSSYFESKT